jgi:hypothetical protein
LNAQETRFEVDYIDYDDYIGDDFEIAGLEPEVGRRRGLRRFGRAFGALATGGLSEVAIARRQARRAKSAAKRAMALQGAPTIPKTSSFGLVPGAQRQASLPLGSVSILAGATAQLRVTCERPIQGQRLFLQAIDPATGARLLGTIVTDIRVGVRPQECAVGDQPLDVFDPTSLQAALQLDPLGVGVSFTVGLRNPTSVDAVINGVLFGVAAD